MSLIREMYAAYRNIEGRTGLRPRHILVTRDQFNELRRDLPYPEAKHLHDHHLLFDVPVIILEGPVLAVGMAQVWLGDAR